MQKEESPRFLVVAAKDHFSGNKIRALFLFSDCLMTASAAKIESDRLGLGDSAQIMVALLGRQDRPTDALRDYCSNLSEALKKHGVILQLVEFSWERDGWLRALWELWKESRNWRGKCVLLQYTALMWSRRGFPFGVLVVLGVLRLRGTKVVGVFHDISASPGPRLVERLQINFQYGVMKVVYRLAHVSITTVPVDRVPWLPIQPRKAVFVPIGPNVPSSDELFKRGFQRAPQNQKTVSVFCFTGKACTLKEVEAIAYAVRRAASVIPELRLVIFGRGAKQAEPHLRQALDGTRVVVKAKGLLEQDEVSKSLVQSDVLLFVRGAISTRRGSALAGIACGLPVVAYQGAETDFPITEAGIMLVPENDKEALGNALTRVLTEDDLRERLRKRSLDAYHNWFSWDRIAGGILEAVAGDYMRGQSDELAAIDSIVVERSSVRVLIYSHDFLPIAGGVQTYVMLLAKGLIGRCLNVTVVTQTPAHEFEDPTLPFRVIRRPSLAVLWRLIGEADVVQLAGPAFLPLILSFLWRKAVVIEHHGYQAVCPNGALFYEPTKTICKGHFMAKHYQECICCNAVTVGWLKSLRMLLLTFFRRWMCQNVAINAPISRHVLNRLELRRSQVVYYGVAEQLADQQAFVALSSSTTPLCFAYVGRLVWEKGLHLLLEAAARLKGLGYDFRLKFVGDGPERTHLETMVHASGLNRRVSFTGFLWGEPLHNALEDVAVVVMPSIWEETAGLAAMEQMIRGRLVVVADIGGLGEVVGDAGLKFPAGDVGALTACLRRVLDEPGLLAEMGQRARSRARELFTQERMVVDHLRMYTRLTHQKQRVSC